MSKETAPRRYVPPEFLDERYPRYCTGETYFLEVIQACLRQLPLALLSLAKL
jgi:hypothetical protein